MFAQDERGEVYALTSISTGPVGGHDKIYGIGVFPTILVYRQIDRP
jgi:hypothetical protein